MVDDTSLLVPLEIGHVYPNNPNETLYYRPPTDLATTNIVNTTTIQGQNQSQQQTNTTITPAPVPVPIPDVCNGITLGGICLTYITLAIAAVVGYMVLKK